MSNAASRLIHLILLLQSKPNRKVAQLAAELGVSVRTVHRYFAALEEIGIPLYSERGPHGGFALVRGYRLPPLVFTPEEAAALSLGAGLVEQTWGSLYRDSSLSARTKLDNLLPEEQRREVEWAHRSLVTAGLNRSDPVEINSILENLRKALHGHIQVTITYAGQNRGKPTRRTVDPYALVHRSGWWVLVGRCHLRQEVRSFRVDRIQQLKLLQQPYRIPPEFEINAYLAREPQAQPKTLARIRFDARAAGFVRTSGIQWISLEEQVDGSLIAALSADDIHFTASLVLSFGPWATVLEPEGLRTVIADWASSTLEQHRPQKKLD